MRLLIAGAGDLGGVLARLASAAGHQVTTLRRSAIAVAGTTLLQADVRDPHSWLAPQPDFDALVWCPTPDQRDAAGYHAIYQQALDDVLALWASRAALPRVVLVSSTAVYAEDGEQHDEHSTRFAASWNGQALLAAECSLHARLAEASVLRLGGIYGPGRTWLLRRVRAGETVQESPPRWTNRIHVEDAAAAALLLLQTQSPPRICNGVDTGCAPEHMVLDWLAVRMQLPNPPRHAGSERGKQVVPAELKRLGFAWRHPDFRSGYAQMLET